MKNKNLLILSHSYSNFIKDQIECISPYFYTVNVLVRHAALADIYSILPLDWFSAFRKDVKIDLKDLPANVHVYTLPLYYLPVSSGYKALGEKHFRAAEKTIRKHKIKFDVLHAHMAWSSGYAAAKLKQKYDVPCLVTAHGTDIYNLPFRNAYWQKKISWVLNNIDHIITVSKNNLSCVHKLSSSTPTSLIPNGFRDKNFRVMNKNECRNRLSLPIDKKIILSVGHLIEVKGHRYLIEAMSQVLRTRDDLLCIIIGDGQLKRKLIKSAADFGISESIIIMDSHPHDEIGYWMNACDLFVLPSLNEGLPVVNIEALACGIPVVATYNGGSEDLILNENLGYLVEPKNSLELADKIRIALDREWDADEISRSVSNYRWEMIASKIINIYESILT